ncbi:gp53-like domain-containing protein [Brevundimonas diminuta]|uniref:gp53-like domain-containing protein n=1 Tax=Brevundimonas diminuta TaxID=293 RepID=UPI00145CFCDA|nr:hypothetical protein [Brevundimonas diminuta]
MADDVIHVTINDTTADTYTLRAFGLYFASGTLFAVCTSVEPIMEKAAAAMLLQAVDITLTTLDTASISFGGTGFTNPPATTERMGVVELATAEEAVAGLDTVRAVTPYGLGRALMSWASNFAAKIHNHAMGDIEGLGLALAGKAGKVHDHDASETKTGVFQVDRIPKLSIGWINNLTETLSDKASALHSHTMAQVSGLIGALALKANLDSPDITGWARLPAVTLFKKELPNTSEGGQLRLEKPDTGTRLAGHVVMDVTGDNVRIYEDAEPYRGLTIPLAGLAAGAGSYPWTSANFNPDSRVSVAATNLGATWDVPLTKLSSAAQFAALPSGFTSMVTPDSVGTPGGYGYLFKMARRDSGHGWTGLWINHTAAPGDAPELYVGSAMVGSELPVWTRAWTWANFNPATKANVQYPDFYGQINLESGPARFRAIGDGDSLFLQAGTATGNNGNMILSGLFGQNLTSLRAQIGGALRDLFHTGNFNPASKADLNGWTNPDGDATVTGNKTFACPVDNTIARGNLDFGRGALEVRAKTGDGAAYLTFHRPGQFAAFFGVDTDGELKFGGWSLGEVSYRIWSERNLRQANPAEAAAGVAHDRFITPSALWSFAKSIGPNGYQQIPGTDLIIQWGVSSGSHPEGAVHAALPVAFGGGCLFACATPRNAGQAYGMDFVMQIVGRYLDRIVFYANRANSSSGNMSGYEWMAIGLARGNPDPVYSSGYPPGGGGGGGEDPFIRPEV